MTAGRTRSGASRAEGVPRRLARVDAAAVLALAIIGASVAVTGLVIPFAATAVVSQRSENAADAAALAAADALAGAVPGTPCTLAAAAAERNGARLASGEVDGPAPRV